MMTQVFCKKKCFNKTNKARNATTTGTSALWNKDGKDGPDDPINFELVLINWLIVPGNYAKYRGKNDQGKKKIHYADEIAKKTNNSDVCVHRDKDRVKAKIEYIDDVQRRDEQGTKLHQPEEMTRACIPK